MDNNDLQIVRDIQKVITDMRHKGIYDDYTILYALEDYLKSLLEKTKDHDTTWRVALPPKLEKDRNNQAILAQSRSRFNILIFIVLIIFSFYYSLN
jgi:uncharacterized linocin/CFP29 family protein